MTRHLNKALPFEEWPVSDRVLFHQSVANSPQGNSGRRSASTTYGRRAAYGLWLGFLAINEPQLLQGAPLDRITRERIGNYLEYLRVNCRDTTVAHCLSRLFYVLRKMDPEVDRRWLYDLSRDIARAAVPMERSQVQGPALYQLGLRMMDRALVKARHCCRMTKSCAISYRDGLLIAVLIEAPMRRRAFASLRLEQHVVRIGRCWWLTVPGHLSKTSRSQQYPLSERVSRYLEIYLRQVRSTFPGSESHDYLWTQVDRPMTDKMIRRRIVKATYMHLGEAVSPHDFRAAAASFLATSDPRNVRSARDLLGHRAMRTTERHYVRIAQSRVAGRELARLVQGQYTTFGKSPVNT